MDYVFQFGAVLQRSDQIVGGLLLTIGLSALAIVFGFLIGTLCAQLRIAGPPGLRRLAGAYVEFIRNTPFLAQLFLVAFGLPQLLATLGVAVRPSPAAAAVVALSLNLGGYAAEIVRAGLLAVPRGQVLAAQALGLVPLTIFLRVQLPQALAKVYPALTGQFVLQMLGSSVVSTIAVQELTGAAGRIQSETFRTFEVYALVTLIYFALAYLFRLAFALVARWLLPWRGRAHA